MKIVHLNGKPYAVNLWWQVPTNSESPKALMEAARMLADTLADTETFNCASLRDNQFGLGLCHTAKVPHIPALAASVRPQLRMAQGFLGIFRLDEGWWVCVITHDSNQKPFVAADGDRLFDTEDEARAHAQNLRHLLNDCDEPFCVTPEESRTFLEPLLEDAAKLVRLHTDPAFIRKMLWGTAGVLCLGLLLFGVKWLWDARIQDSALKNARQLMQSKDSRRREILADSGQHFPRSWLGAPAVLAVSGQCLPELMAVPLSGNGWALESAICRPDMLLTTWNHRPGASFTRLPHEARLKNKKQAEGKRKLPLPASRGHDDPLLSQETASSRLYEIARLLRCRVNPNWESPDKKVVEEVEVTAPWVRGKWTMEAVPSALLEDAFTLLSRIPGLSVSEILFDRSWTVKGDVYANLK